MKRLAIISHTEHYRLADGVIVGFGPTVAEINHLLEVFDSIHHIAMIHEGEAPAHALQYATDRITFVPIPVLGGPDVTAKIKLLGHAFSILRTIAKTLRKVDYFQFRGPTGIGVFVMPYLILFSHKKGWFKYAGNWKQTDAPIAYRFQKWLLKQQKRNVTINGHWNDQPAHCLSFENPCLTNEDLLEGQTARDKKTVGERLDFCFVGRLEPEKGIDLILDAFGSLGPSETSRIGTVHIVGGGEQQAFYKNKAKNRDVNFIFHGVLSHKEVRGVYKTSMVMLLPSASEGFPKVIAEAMNYGCLPMVSNVSSIGHYVVDGHNGFLFDELSKEGIINALGRLFSLTNEAYLEMIQYRVEALKPFSFAYYNQRIQNELL